MADVTISALTNGVPAGSNIVPYSTGTVTLGVPVSAMFQSTNAVSIGGIASGVVTSVPSRLAIVGSGALNPTSYMSLSSCLLLCNNSQNSGTFDVPDTSTGSTVAILGGSALVSGIGFAREAQTTWGTQIRFYTHAPSTSIPVDSITERMRIDSNGIVTKPFQPAFHVWNQADQTLTNNTVMQFDAATSNSARVFNQGGHYANNKFTAPVAGVYQFSLNVVMNSAALGAARRVGFVLNGTDLLDYAYAYRDTTYQSMNVSATIKLAAADYIDVRASTDGAMYMDNSGYFSGHLVG